MHPLRRVSKYLFRYRGLFALTLALAVGQTMAGVSVPRAIQWIFNHVIANREVGMLTYGVLFIMGLYAIEELLNCLRIRVNNTVEQKVLLDLRQDLHSKLLELPVSFYDRRKSGDVASRVIDDVQDVERALLDGTEQGVRGVLMVIGVAVSLFLMEPLLAVLVLLPVPILLLLGRSNARASRKNWHAVRSASGELNSLLMEDIQGNRLIQSFALQKRERARFLQQANNLRLLTLKAMFRWSIQGPLSNFVTSLGTVAVVGVGGWLMIHNDAFTMGEVVAFFFYAAMLVDPIDRLNALNNMLAAASASGQRVFEVLDHPVEVKNPENPTPFPASPLTAVYENVGFSYPERDQVIENLNLTLPAGKITALVGHTGAGKSTIANLLLRYFDPTEGRVTLNGIDVRTIALAELRGNIGYVSQEPFLFDGTVEDNLRLAREEATEAMIEEALRGARAWDFVTRLPNGIRTQIGERGIRLSVGEKQRITVARVLLKNPSLIILDEATASVDTMTERLIQEALETLLKDRTVLVIAHRLSTVRKADQIVVLERGRIVEQGPHGTLIKANGHYAALWRYQSDLIPEPGTEPTLA
ncbi:MAG: ABC transporter ATP-binding protein [Verrucomicrobiota bacterium]|nr:ABC transporter ATP-binding protein [Verrucomicrobiota bacterium]